MKKTKKQNNTLQIVGVIAITIVVLALIFTKSDRTETVELKTDEFKESYMGGCVEVSSDIPYCDCTFNYLENELGRKGFREFTLRLSNESETTSDNSLFFDTIDHCIDLL